MTVPVMHTHIEKIVAEHAPQEVELLLKKRAMLAEEIMLIDNRVVLLVELAEKVGITITENV